MRVQTDNITHVATCYVCGGTREYVPGVSREACPGCGEARKSVTGYAAGQTLPRMTEWTVPIYV